MHSPDLTVHLTPAGTRQAVAGVRNAARDPVLVLEDAVGALGLGGSIRVEPIELVSAPGVVLDERYFLLEEGCCYSDRFVRELAAAPSIARFGSIEAVRSRVVADLGWPALPRVAVAEQLDARSLQRGCADCPTTRCCWSTART